MRTVLVIALFVAVASAVPLAQKLRNHAADLQAQTLAQTNPPPALSGSFHTTYSIVLINVANPQLGMLSRLLSQATHLIDGECWQNTNADGTVTIKTVTTPKALVSLVAQPSTSTWVKNHGWTETQGHCTADAANAQLVIPGDILTKTGKFVQTMNLEPVFKPTFHTPAPNADNTYTVDVWDATLPNGEGTVRYFLLHGTTTPLMSHYVFVLPKPAVWAQYTLFTAGTNPDAVYAPSAPCVAASAAHAGPVLAGPAQGPTGAPVVAAAHR